MGNLFSRLFRGVLVVVFGLILNIAHAETIAPLVSKYAPSWKYGSGSSGYIYDSPDASCIASFAGSIYVFAGAEKVPSNYNYLCLATYPGVTTPTAVSGVQGKAICQGTDPFDPNTSQCLGSYCPSGYDGPKKINGSFMCEKIVCDDGFPPVDGKCLKDCTSKLGQSAPGGSYYVRGDAIFGPGIGSVYGCQIQCTNFIALVCSSSGGCAFQMDGCKFTGKSGDLGNESPEGPPVPPDNYPKNPEDCSSKGLGYIVSSGNIKCIPSGSDGDMGGSGGNTGGGDTGGTGGTGGGGGNSGGGEGSPVGCLGPGCDSGGGSGSGNGSNGPSGPGSGNGTGDGDKGDDKGNTFGGDCQTGFTCAGDEALCAAAKASWELRCEYQKGGAGLINEDAPGGTGDQISDGEAALNKDGKNDFDIAAAFQEKHKAWVNYSSSCPAAGVQTFQIGKATIKFDWTFLCTIGGFIRLLIHIVAYMAVARIFVDMVK